MSISYTEEQEKIFAFVQSGVGHGIIDAVAGAGKTTTIMHCAKFIEDKSSILFCAFNKSISNEIRSKFGKIGLNITVDTIHALGWRILRCNNKTTKPLTLEDNKYSKLLKSDEIQEKLAPWYEKLIEINDLDPLSLDDKQKFAIRNLMFIINRRLIDINQKARATLVKEHIDDFKKLVEHFGIFNSIEIKKKNYQTELTYYFEAHKILLEHGNNWSEKTMIIDYTDMLYLPYKWNLYPNQRYAFLFIDECQDLSNSQLAIALKYGKKTGRILAVGDPSQSIYGFTGADIESFQRVKKLTNAVPLLLTGCFRCPQKVIALAKHIRPDITGIKGEAGTVTTILYDDIIVIAQAGDLIISRLRAPLLLLVFDFIDRNIKVHIHDDEVNEVIKGLKEIFKPNELQVIIDSLDSGFEDIKNPVMSRWKWKIRKEAERIVDSAERDIYIEDETEHIEKILNFLNRKYELWKDECPNINEILKKIKKYVTATENAIRLSTIHRAKGLENERVFILNYDQLPHKHQEQKEWEKIQELNLKYVAITRAKTELLLVESKKQNLIEEEGSLFDNLPFA